jgi:hypothetical protein
VSWVQFLAHIGDEGVQVRPAALDNGEKRAVGGLAEPTTGRGVCGPGR